jgi:hypothetical protein
VLRDDPLGPCNLQFVYPPGAVLQIELVTDGRDNLGARLTRIAQQTRKGTCVFDWVLNA